jgi:triosephosphate isomerase
MVMDKTLIVGNWKMNFTVHEASLYIHQLEKLIQVRRDVEVVLAPSILALQTLSLQVDFRQFKLAAQNFYWRDNGAFTGEVSASQLRGIVQYGIIGHSDRRHNFCESDKDVRAKMQAAIRNSIRPILCIGETINERSNNETNDALRDQLIGGLANLTSDELEEVVIAYEPVWAIGTGDIALPRDVTLATKTIRSQITHLYGKKAAEAIKVIYGGSVTSNSAADYLVLEGIDGLLVGGASLEAHEFSKIVETAHKDKEKTND